MATNPFDGIITSAMKTLHKNMIDALLANSALTVPCIPIYEGSSKEPIIGGNPVDPIGNKPQGVYLHGSPAYNTSGDTEKYKSIEGETVYLMVIWSSKDWIKTSVSESLINTPNTHVQILCKATEILVLKQCDKLIVDTDIESKVRHIFQRASEPEPCGFNSSHHFITMWKKIGG